jgi:hypothetical protein
LAKNKVAPWGISKHDPLSGHYDREQTMITTRKLSLFLDAVQLRHCHGKTATGKE